MSSVSLIPSSFVGLPQSQERVSRESNDKVGSVAKRIEGAETFPLYRPMPKASPIIMSEKARLEFARRLYLEDKAFNPQRLLWNQRKESYSLTRSLTSNSLPFQTNPKEIGKSFEGTLVTPLPISSEVSKGSTRPKKEASPIVISAEDFLLGVRGFLEGRGFDFNEMGARFLKEFQKQSEAFMASSAKESNNQLIRSGVRSFEGQSISEEDLLKLLQKSLEAWELEIANQECFSDELSLEEQFQLIDKEYEKALEEEAFLEKQLLKTNSSEDRERLTLQMREKKEARCDLGEKWIQLQEDLRNRKDFLEEAEIKGTDSEIEREDLNPLDGDSKVESKQIKDLRKKIEDLKSQKMIHIRTGHGKRVDIQTIRQLEKSLEALLNKQKKSDLLPSENSFQAKKSEKTGLSGLNKEEVDSPLPLVGSSASSLYTGSNGGKLGSQSSNPNLTASTGLSLEVPVIVDSDEEIKDPDLEADRKRLAQRRESTSVSPGPFRPVRDRDSVNQEQACSVGEFVLGVGVFALVTTLLNKFASSPGQLSLKTTEGSFLSRYCTSDLNAENMSPIPELFEYCNLMIYGKGASEVVSQETGSELNEDRVVVVSLAVAIIAIGIILHLNRKK